VFFELLFYCVSRTENSSLSFMVSYLESQFGIKIRKQSLDERYIALLLAKLLLIIINIQITYSAQQFFAHQQADKIPILKKNRGKKTLLFTG
jgi:hypothetical protein